MKNHRFLWLRNRTTDNRKCEKARNIKEKRTIEMFSTVSRQLVVHRSSASVNRLLQTPEKPRKQAVCAAFSYPKIPRIFCPSLSHFVTKKSVTKWITGHF